MKSLSVIIDKVDGIKSTNDLVSMLGELNSMSVSLPLNLAVSTDVKASDKMAVFLSQASLGLPDRDYYLGDSPEFVKYRADYKTYITTTLKNMGVESPEEYANKIFDLETKLAEAQKTNVENRDPSSTYNKYSIEELKKLSSDIDWNTYFKQSNLSKLKSVVVEQPDFVKALGGLLSKTDIETWKTYLKFNIMNNYAAFLGDKFYQPHFDFYDKELSGLKVDKAANIRAVSVINDHLGDAIGKIYVENNFDKKSKAKVAELVKNLINVFDTRIDQIEWMDDESKKGAHEKLSTLNVKVGYPDKWENYSKLDISQDNLVQNIINSSKFQYNKNLDDLSKPVDKLKWGMTPQTVNAYYSPDMNEIVFPAAILQPPFYMADADMAANYGAIGSVIGHEISHGFDDTGSQYDSKGNLNPWMSKASLDKFKQNTQKLVAQYNQYEPIAGYHINGELTLGENIGDNSGIAIAYKAYQLSLSGRDAPVIDNLTGDQRFYISHAQSSLGVETDGFLIDLITTNPHAQDRVRVDGTLKNQESFYTAFDIKPSDKMFLPEGQRTTIW